jgi:hypothetical protein
MTDMDAARQKRRGMDAHLSTVDRRLEVGSSICACVHVCTCVCMCPPSCIGLMALPRLSTLPPLAPHIPSLFHRGSRECREKPQTPPAYGHSDANSVLLLCGTVFGRGLPVPVGCSLSLAVYWACTCHGARWQVLSLRLRLSQLARSRMAGVCFQPELCPGLRLC